MVTAKHGVEHHIDTKGPLVYARARRLNPDRLKVARSEFANMERLGIIRHSPWASTSFPSQTVGGDLVGITAA